ncbi:hypothetical protein ID866_6525 [Astraeus odoratus]|nr:hypothetical protein ID866_6525 [Astraeus odoratus]
MDVHRDKSEGSVDQAACLSHATFMHPHPSGRASVDNGTPRFDRGAGGADVTGTVIPVVAGNNPRSLVGLLGKRTQKPPQDAHTLSHSEQVTTSRLQTPRRNFDGIRRPELTPLSIIPHPADSTATTGGFATSKKPHAASFTFSGHAPHTVAGAVRGKSETANTNGEIEQIQEKLGGENSNGDLNVDLDICSPKPLDVGCRAPGYTRSPPTMEDIGSVPVHASVLAAPVPGYAPFDPRETEADINAVDNTGRVDERICAPSANMRNLEEDSRNMVVSGQILDTSAATVGTLLLARGMRRERPDETPDQGHHQQGQRSPKRARQHSDEDNYLALSGPASRPTGTPISVGYPPQQNCVNLESLFVDIGDFINEDEFAAECKRWTECTREQWSNGTDGACDAPLDRDTATEKTAELSKDFQIILDMVKDHLTGRMLSYSSLTRAVTEKRAEVDRDMQILKDVMAGTQQLPPWMTLSVTTITNSEGIPLTTSTTTLQLPLTYYGPSIPLGTDGAWTWGGLYPPSSSPSSLASATATPTVLSSSTFSSSLPTSSASPTSTSATLATTAPLASTTSASASSTPTVTSSSLSKGELVAIIFGAIVAFVLLLLLLVFLVRWRTRRNRNGYRPTPIWTHWEVISPTGPRSMEEDRPAGVGSPRGSGDEINSLLQRSRTGAISARHQSSSLPSLPPGAAPPVIGSTNSGDSGHTSSSAVTDYGVLLPEGGRIGQAYARDGDMFFPAARASSEMTGHIIPPGELLRIDDEEEPQSPPRMYSVSHGDDSDPLLAQFASLPPPPPLDPEKHSTRKVPSVNDKEKSLHSLSYPASDMEASEVYTARRVRVRDVGLRSPATDETSSHDHVEAGPVAGPSSWRSSFGFGSLQKLRMSWFGGSSRNTSHSSSGRVRTDDIESTQSLLQAPRVRPRSGLGVVIGGDRPISTVSAKSAVSGNTVYHDAISHLGTPVSVPSRAMTPANGGGAAPGQEAPVIPTSAPPAYALEDPYSSLASRGSFPYSQGVDILDLPVPAPASQFTASGGTSRVTPPGLGRSEVQQSATRDSVVTGSSNEAGITIDVLDAEPPRAGEGWRTMAEGLPPLHAFVPESTFSFFGIWFCTNFTSLKCPLWVVIVSSLGTVTSSNS